MKKTLLLLVLVAFSCDVKEEFKTITISDKYSLDIPDSFEKADNLNDEASLQYQNALKEFYVIVMDEPKETFDTAVTQYQVDMTPDLEGYYKAIQLNLKNAIKNIKIFNEKNTEINGRKAKIFSITGNVEGYDIFYRYALVQGKKDYYQIMLWTEQKNGDHYLSTMDQSINSFKELIRHDKLYKGQ
ncbi:hypothetical protein [Flavobacterium sp. TBRC 19031]|uniref:hypothetical protein n=1 Tax=Flavobacterium mekongense TaxID=3379707 RepID=UPI00399959C4